jgi:3-hydroxyacyl-[acyl-carrier-protein] dehydratase
VEVTTPISASNLPKPTELIPHRSPMLLIDEIVELGADHIVATKKLEVDEVFVQGHYPGYPLLPGAITCECIFQAGAALLAHRMQNQMENVSDDVPVITRIRGAKFRSMIKPPATITLKVELIDSMAQVFNMRGQAIVDGETMVKVDFACALVSEGARS